MESRRPAAGLQKFRNALSTAGNSMTSSERPSPELGGGDNSGNALEASNALKYRVWAIPAVLSKGIQRNALREFPGSFRNFSGISSGKSQPYWGDGPKVPIPRSFVGSVGTSVGKKGEAFVLTVGVFCLQLSFFAYSPLRPLLNALSHCKQKSFNCKQRG